ncbi:Fur family transcriptional regulator [Nitrosophilus labii]|uniref:Fur family transcriptional regulator n=1 Tax=Nitrosophilus labii TaxID=2706014 RepID=UPI0016574052|nr:Fur family transcriptional regulator [Nitrosophilus labii]
MQELDFSNLLKKYDLKATPQRVIFLRELQKAGHLSIEELESRVKSVIPTISTATIYKNINSMVQKGLLHEVKLPGIKTKYEITKNRHAHFFCESCQKVLDIEINTSCIYQEIDKEFSINEVNISIQGICKECMKDNKKVS